jgi:hypothetical protein
MKRISAIDFFSVKEFLVLLAALVTRFFTEEKLKMQSVFS